MTRVLPLIVVLTSATFASALHGQFLPQSRDANRLEAGTGVIRGRVVAATTGDPIQNARIGIVGIVDDVVHSVLTDAEGRFVLTHVPAGSHVVSAIKAGFAETRYGARGSGPPLRVDVGNGVTVDSIDIRLPRGGAISGRVVDDFGDPLPNATVSAERLVRVDGRLDTRPAATAQSDDQGEYRLFGLSAGQFVIAVTGLADDGFSNTTWGRSYYPGASALAQAQPITVLAGSDIPAIDFTSAPARKVSVTITVTDTSGEPASAQVVFGNESPLASAAFRASAFARQNAAVARLNPGNWVVFASGPKGVGMIRLTVAGDDIETTLVLTTGGRLSGRVVTDGSPLPINAQVELEARATDASLAHANVVSRSRPIRLDGAFELTALLGEREIGLRSAPKGWILAEVLSHGRSLLDAPPDFSAGESIADVQVVLSNHRAALTGTVTITGTGAETARDCSVLVFPADPVRLRHAQRWARWLRPRNNGAFAIDDLLPGDYMAVALRDVDETQWQNADYLERFRSRATPVTLGDRHNAPVTLVPVDTP